MQYEGATQLTGELKRKQARQENTVRISNIHTIEKVPSKNHNIQTCESGFLT
jgi:hypothetical protein